MSISYRWVITCYYYLMPCPIILPSIVKISVTTITISTKQNNLVSVRIKCHSMQRSFWRFITWYCYLMPCTIILPSVIKKHETTFIIINSTTAKQNNLVSVRIKRHSITISCRWTRCYYFIPVICYWGRRRWR